MNQWFQPDFHPLSSWTWQALSACNWCPTQSSAEAAMVKKSILITSIDATDDSCTAVYAPTWCCLYPCLSQVLCLIIVTLEPVCRKIAVTQQLFCCPLKVLNCTKLVLDDLGNNSFNISLESFRSFRGPLLHKPVTGQELFFDVSYSKLALIKPFKKN